MPVACNGCFKAFEPSTPEQTYCVTCRPPVAEEVSDAGASEVQAEETTSEQVETQGAPAETAEVQADAPEGTASEEAVAAAGGDEAAPGAEATAEATPEPAEGQSEVATESTAGSEASA